MSAAGGTIDLREIDAITFDCYGTLIDWETGILAALEPFLERWGAAAGGTVLRSVSETDTTAQAPGDGSESRATETLARYADFEREAQRGAAGERFRPYREVLALVLERFAAAYGGRVEPGERFAIAESIRDWPAFAETPGALRALKRHARLAVLSNIDDCLFEQTRPNLGVKLNEVVTAEQVRSYKPALAHFDEALRRLGTAPQRILHVAESRYHDVAPARALGLRTVWVNRSAGRGASASGAADARPDLEVPDLTSLVRLLVAKGAN